MLYLLISTLLTAPTLAKASPAEAPLDKPIVLGIDQKQDILIGGNAQIRIGKKSLVKVIDRGNTLTIVGKKIGATEIITNGQKRKIIVCKKSIYQAYQSLSRWLQDRRGLKLKIQPRSLSIGGRLLVADDLLSLQNFNSGTNDFQFKAQIGEEIRTNLNKSIEQLIADYNLVKGELIFSPTLQYMISNSEKSKKNQYNKVLGPMGIPVQINGNSLVQKPMIHVQVLICQVSQRFFRNYGLEWPSVAKGQVVGSSGLGLTANYSFDFAAHMLEREGFGKVVASPTLVTRSHSEAKFHSGGEFPVQAQGTLYSQVEWKKHGILLKILPKADRQNKLEIEIKAEISLLDYGKAQNGIPAIEKSEMNSIFYLPKPRPIVLSGLVKKSWRDNRAGLPLLSQIPLLNPLFSTTGQENDISDLVFIVQAKVVQP